MRGSLLVGSSVFFLFSCGGTRQAVTTTADLAPRAVVEPAAPESCPQVALVIVLTSSLEVPDATSEAVAAYAAAHVAELDAEIARDPEVFENLPAERRFRHLLIAAAADATPREVTAAERRAEALLRRIRGGEDFAVVARAESADEGTAAAGGDLGWLRSGMVMPAIDEAVFAATAPGLLPHPIRTTLGFHLIEVTGVRPARERASTEEARETVAPQLEELSRQAVVAEDLFARAIARARADGSSLREALLAVGGEERFVSDDNHGSFRPDEVPTALSINLFGAPDDTLARAAALAPGEMSGPVVGRQFTYGFERLEDGVCVPRFVLRVPPDPPDPLTSAAARLLSTGHGLAWAYSDCYRAHALEGERSYGTIAMRATVDSEGSDYEVTSDGLGNDDLRECVVASFERARSMTSEGAPEATVTFEIAFEPPRE